MSSAEHRTTGGVYFGTLTLLVLLVLTINPVFAQPSPTSQGGLRGKTVAVPAWESFGEAASKQAWLAEALRQLVIRDLSRISELGVISPSSYDRKLSSAGLTELNPNDSDNAGEIARAVGAGALLVGTYQIKQNRIQLSAVFYAPSTGQTLAAHSELGSLGQIKTLETKLVRELLRKAGIPLGTSELNWLNREKTLETDAIALPTPKPRPEVLQRNQQAQSLYQALQRVGDTVPRDLVDNRWVVGVHWPGVSLGYRASRYTTVEFRAEANSDITVLGGRFNNHFYHFGDSNVYWGAQVSHVDFTGEVSEGTGFLGGGFIGFEQYATDYMSFKADVGTYLTNLEDDATGVSDTGIGFSLVTGVAFHFL